MEDKVIAMLVGQEGTKLLVAWRNGKVADRTCRFSPRRPDQKKQLGSFSGEQLSLESTLFPGKAYGVAVTRGKVKGIDACQLTTSNT
jgi:hypothetical protein